MHPYRYIEDPPTPIAPKPIAPKPLVLLVGHAGIPTGFARVLHTLAVRLAAEFETHLLGITQPVADFRSLPYTLHPNPDELHSPETLLRLCRRLRPALCLILDEPWVCAERVTTLRALCPSPRVLCYCAADEPAQLPAHILGPLGKADCLVAFTQQARSYIRDAFTRQGLDPPSLGVIPHGVDTGVFRSLPRAWARELVFPDAPELRDSFIVLNANRNQPFKRIDLTLEGFALFARDKPASVRLCLHMGSRKPASGEIPWADRLGIRGRLLHPPGGGASTHTHHLSHNLADEQLNLLYNACDVGINTSDREGWGLVSFEHAATGAPQIVPGLVTLAEIWQDAALILPTRRRPSTQLPGRLAPAVRPRDLAEALDRLYSDPAARASSARAAYELVRRDCFRWPTIADEWIHVIHTTIRHAKTPASSTAQPYC